MATVRAMLRRTGRKIDEEIENMDMIDWFNDCLDELSDIVFIPTEVELTRHADGYFSLPPNYNNNLMVSLDKNGAPLMLVDPRFKPGAQGYYQQGNRIYLINYPDVTEIHILYNRKPAAIQNNPDQVPEIPAQFHRIFEFYACAAAMLADEEHERFNMFNNQYLKVRSLMASYMYRERSRYFPLGKWEVRR